MKLINISHKQILDWKKQSEKMKGKSNQHAKSLGDGVQSFLSPYTDRLLSFIFEMRETGMAVSVNSIVLKVLQLSRELREKSMTARHSAIRRFINIHGIVHRMGTHLSQRQPSEMEEIATDLVRVTWEKLQMSCRDEAYIINMDQTPVLFSYDPKNTIEMVGRRTIHNACQDNAWMDERVMLMWVDMVFKPDVDTAPEDVAPILIFWIPIAVT